MGHTDAFHTALPSSYHTELVRGSGRKKYQDPTASMLRETRCTHRKQETYIPWNVRYWHYTTWCQVLADAMGFPAS